MEPVAKLDERREYIEIRTANGDTHAIPVSVFRHVIAGKLTVNKIADFIPIYQEITRQWFNQRGLK